MPRDAVWGWVGPALVALLAGVLRFPGLGQPPGKIFDEVYYAENAQDYLRYGVEYDQALHTPSFIVHPPAGKWVIALGEWGFGNDAFGWRFAVAVLGTLSVLLLARIGRRLFRSTLLGCIAGLLLAVDGLHFVMSRTALLDLILMVFVLGAFGCLLVDRDRVHARLAGVTARFGGRRLPGVGPGFGVRPWRIGAGVMLGLACATKWSGIWYVAAFGLMSLLWDVNARRLAGVRRPFVAAVVRDAGPAFASIVCVAVAVYVLSWTGWFLAGPGHAYGRDWAATHPGTLLVPDALRSLWHYHAQMWTFHTTLHEPHAWQSNPWGWLILARPVLFYYRASHDGDPGCTVADCAQVITALGTPALWWGGVAALAVLLFLWAAARDWRAGAVLAGVAAGYLPWFLWQERTIFAFYSVVYVPWIVLAVTMVLGLVIGPRDASPTRRSWGAAAAGAYVIVVILSFGWLYPVLSGRLIPYADWVARTYSWFPSWW